ncbi:hypothetical protein P168DRAFT_238142 [Aspergillus campestris IBT 28561]|uniref:Uncharacterized protein n=1 Tax=Aspergillus campestris (strain IBT 28561) TaxID=1392248 RepID=A0A2I1D0C9_ASPC2|nr:uncharacterized protein P168DRAFT_238142 [Aspergillus campestris IBT 28561]PKY03333.1 hypothetical protein P168DRAFT_238142 [Aspergillus campestris IBT 28561]
MPPLGETIAVIDKSGKVVSTSKHLFSVFDQAKNAYRQRKAAFQSEKNARIAEQQALKALQNYTIDDGPSVASSRRSRSRHHSGRSHHHHHHRRHQGESVYEQDLQSVSSRSESYYGSPRDVARRHTHHDISMREREGRPMAVRSRSDAQVDMDLAYGDYNETSLARQPAPEAGALQKIEDPELNGLVGRAQWLLEEANCVHHSATQTIAHLQKNPDAMAAVALTLAEISNLASKMAPAALSMLKTAAPGIFALLASPQFLIAAGVGIGVTIVMFGGYKIIKQIQSGGASADTAKQPPPMGGPIGEPQGSMDDMLEFDPEHVSGVEMWRRGVADAESDSVGTSVDGEFITPRAATMSGIDVTTARASRDPRFKFDDDHSTASSRRSRRSRASRGPSRHHRSRGDHVPESEVGSKAPSKRHGRSSSRAPSKAESHFTDGEPKSKDKKKRSSRLRLMFTS